MDGDIMMTAKTETSATEDDIFAPYEGSCHTGMDRRDFFTRAAASPGLPWPKHCCRATPMPR